MRSSVTPRRLSSSATVAHEMMCGSLMWSLYRVGNLHPCKVFSREADLFRTVSRRAADVLRLRRQVGRWALPSRHGCASHPVFRGRVHRTGVRLSLIHISEPTRLGMISYAVFCLKKKK